MGQTRYYTVTATLVHNDPVMVYLTIDNEAIQTTPEHPFYVVEGSEWSAYLSVGKWVDAGELQSGDEVRQADGTTGIVSQVNVVVAAQVMYNLTVDQAHTFFVGDGLWLVHNAKKCAPTQFPKDVPGDNNWSSYHDSEAQARQIAREKLGRNPIEVEPGKWRSKDGKWQYRANSKDVEQNHIHLEELDPVTGQIKQNLHLRWPEGTER